jgi:hypothetical protein
MPVITGLNAGERVALLLLLTKPDSGLVKNLNGNTGTPADRAGAEIKRLRGTDAGVNYLDSLFDNTGKVANTQAVAAALGFTNDDYYDPGGPCPPAGAGDEGIYTILSQNL